MTDLSENQGSPPIMPPGVEVCNPRFAMRLSRSVPLAGSADLVAPNSSDEDLFEAEIETAVRNA